MKDNILKIFKSIKILLKSPKMTEIGTNLQNNQNNFEICKITKLPSKPPKWLNKPQTQQNDDNNKTPKPSKWPPLNDYDIPQNFKNHPKFSKVTQKQVSSIFWRFQVLAIMLVNV